MPETQGRTITRVNLRGGPGTDQLLLRVLDAGTPVIIVEDVGDWLRVHVSGQTGFIKENFVEQERRAVPPGFVSPGTGSEPFADVPLEPAPEMQIRLGARPTGQERLAAATWNHSGNLLSTLASHLQFEAGAAVAVFATESGGKAFGSDGRMMIRFENHLFHSNWGRANPGVFADHFLFDAAKRWTGHQWRATTGEPFQNFHGNQASEWRVFEFARTLDDRAAKLSISMGGPQILGSNHAAAGFESVSEMFEAFAASEKRQIVAFFDFLQGTSTQPRKVLALQKRDFIGFAELYNGPGNATEYGAKIEGVYEAFGRLRPAAAAGGATATA